MRIRDAVTADAALICEVWNPVIRDTAATFSTEARTIAGVEADIVTRQSQGKAFLVAETAGTLLGFATYSQFRGGPGYRFTMEHTVILAPKARGHGVGRALMQALELQAANAGVHSLFAGVSAENDAGISFHAAIGYREVARLPEVGHKFGRWMDLVLMQKNLQNPA